jgi:hypothetical protein
MAAVAERLETVRDSLGQAFGSLSALAELVRMSEPGAPAPFMSMVEDAVKRGSSPDAAVREAMLRLREDPNRRRREEEDRLMREED